MHMVHIFAICILLRILLFYAHYYYYAYDAYFRYMHISMHYFVLRILLLSLLCILILSCIFLKVPLHSSDTVRSPPHGLPRAGLHARAEEAKGAAQELAGGLRLRLRSFTAQRRCPRGVTFVATAPQYLVYCSYSTLDVGYFFRFSATGIHQYS